MYSPIALFCFKRLKTLNACVESLKLCPEAIHKDLVIFSDASRNEEEQKNVDEVRSYIKNIIGFKSIRIIQREENLGVDFNIIRGIQEMAQEFESFIVLEDDLVVSSQFLWFMDAGLCHFKDFEKVLTLSAFNYVKIL
jgi:GT2 family glycosyltransferase